MREGWDAEGDTLLLGPWCTPYDKRWGAALARCQLLRSPWERPAGFIEASIQADAIYRRLLAHLVVRLNQVCGVDESVDYWRVLVGPWLLHFVHAAYDRYAHLMNAVTQEPRLRTAVLDPACFRTPRTTAEAIFWLTQDDHYNWQLFSDLLECLKIPVATYCVQVAPPAAAPVKRRSFRSRLARWGRRLPTPLLRHMDSRNQVWVTAIKMTWSSQFQMAVRSGLRIVPAPVADEVSEMQFPTLREERWGAPDLGVTGADAFESACSRMLMRYLPTVYLEGYRAARSLIQRRYPRMPAVMASETSWYTNETYKYLASEAVARGTRLVAVQHGAVYGLARVFSLEQLERDIGRTFFVWGWAANEPSLRNVPHPILSERSAHSRRRTGSLFVLQSAERYLHRLGSAPMGSLSEPLWQWQAEFIRVLPSPIRRDLIIRLPPDDLGQGVQQRLRDQFQGLSFDSCTNFKKSLAKRTLVIFERLGTGALESLSANTPTVLFWDPNVWQFHPRADPYLDALRRAEVLWDSPAAAAWHVARVAHDPLRWWNQDVVQVAREAFVRRFALAHRNWLRYWVEALEEERTA